MGRKQAANRRHRALSPADALFSRTQQSVLGLIFGQPKRSFYASEVIGLVGAGSGAVQREIERLERSGLVTTRRIGAQKHFQANADSPLYAELCAIARKSVGLAGPIRKALQPFASRIHFAFVYGSWVAPDSTEELALLIVGDSLRSNSVLASLRPVGVKLGNAIAATVYTQAQLAERIASDHTFVRRVLEQPKIWIFESQRVSD